MQELQQRGSSHSLHPYDLPRAPPLAQAAYYIKLPNVFPASLLSFIIRPNLCILDFLIIGNFVWRNAHHYIFSLCCSFCFLQYMYHPRHFEIFGRYIDEWYGKSRGNTSPNYHLVYSREREIRQRRLDKRLAYWLHSDVEIEDSVSQFVLNHHNNASALQGVLQM
ncbi:hypothetical protein BD779DRAFT_263210 [Infundibulicybe gibba]|nr:hypothetical protein BD779DRAFT_263210 [Infundibulicybe gibba]